jgi:hypothetical protein
MNPEKSDKGMKEKAVHEFKEMTIVTAYLAFFFCALATYSMLLIGKSELAYFTYGAAVVNALVVVKTSEEVKRQAILADMAARKAGYDAAHPEEAEARKRAETDAKAKVEADALSAAVEAKPARDKEVAPIKAALALKNSMKDPDAFKLRFVIQESSGAICYNYTSTNSFGGRVQEYALLTPERSLVTIGTNSDIDAWQKYCAGKSGKSLTAWVNANLEGK